jgi:hypothetical protein
LGEAGKSDKFAVQTNLQFKRICSSNEFAGQTNLKLKKTQKNSNHNRSPCGRPSGPTGEAGTMHGGSRIIFERN